MTELSAVRHATRLACMCVGACSPPRKISGKDFFQEVFGKPYTDLHCYTPCSGNVTSTYPVGQGAVGPVIYYLEGLCEMRARCPQSVSSRRVIGNAGVLSEYCLGGD